MTGPARQPSSGSWPIWVVSLADATDRRAGITAQLDALGLKFAFLDAVDGRNGLPAEFEPLVDRPGTLARIGYPMSDPEYACALSHQLAYRKILDDRLPGAVILEDDVLLTDNFRRFYERRGYEAAPLIQFFHFDALMWKTGKRRTAAARLHKLAASAWSTTGYSISAEGAAVMRAHSLPLRGHADWPCDTAGIVGHYVTAPRLVLHADPAGVESAIHGTREGLLPEGFDFRIGHAKGWRRLVSLASWQRLLTRRLKERRRPGFTPTPEEEASLVRVPAPAVPVRRAAPRRQLEAAL